MSIIDVKCEICGHWLAKADTDDLVTPITGAMFQSRDPVHGFPKPFPPSADWLFLICPMCKKRAFMDPDSVMDVNGKRHPARDPAMDNIPILPAARPMVLESGFKSIPNVTISQKLGPPKGKRNGR